MKEEFGLPFWNLYKAVENNLTEICADLLSSFSHILWSSTLLPFSRNHTSIFFKFLYYSFHIMLAIKMGFYFSREIIKGNQGYFTNCLVKSDSKLGGK